MNINKLKIPLLMSMSLCGLGIGEAQAQTASPNLPPTKGSSVIPAPSTTAAETPPGPYSLGLSFDHYLAHRSDLDSYTLVTLDGSFSWSSVNKVEILQTASKLYNIPVGTSEFVIDDTVLYYLRTLYKNDAGFTVKVRPSLMLPTSQLSQNIGMIARTGLQLHLSHKFLKDKLTLGYRPGFSYIFNRYTSTKDGNPIKQMTLGNSLVGEYAFTDAFSFGFFASAGYNFNERSPYQAGYAPPTGSYGYDVHLQYSVNPYVGPRVGISHNDSFTKEGRYEINIYDPINTRYYLAVDFSI